MILSHNSTSEDVTQIGFYFSALPASHRLRQLVFTLLALSSALWPVARADTDSVLMTNGLFLPQLGNTDETDKELLREITDAQVFISSAHPSSQSSAAVDNADSVAATRSVWDHVRASEPIKYQMTAEVEAQVEQYLEDAWWVNKTLERARPFLYPIVLQLTDRRLPLDLALIPAVESGYQPYATSALSAVGLWQIVPITADEIGMKRSTWFDERGDLELSTRAALDYLSYLNAEFQGDWELTLAAYNAGPGRVKAAMRKNRQRDKPVDFWSLQLPQETKNYVPKVLALSQLIRQTPKSPLTLPDILPFVGFGSVDAGTRISLDRAAELAGVPAAELRNLNAGLVYAVTAPEGPHILRIPRRAVKRFRQRLNDLTNTTSLYSLPRIHVVTAGDTISSIARKYGIQQKQLKTMNNIRGSKILLGQKLAVLEARHHASQDSPAFRYTIKSGDTLSEIAARFNVQMADITFLSGDNARERTLIPGQKLVIRVRPGANRG